MTDVTFFSYVDFSNTSLCASMLEYQAPGSHEGKHGDPEKGKDNPDKDKDPEEGSKEQQTKTKSKKKNNEKQSEKGEC